MKISIYICLCIISIASIHASLYGYDEEALFERLDADEQEILRGLHLLLNTFQQKQYLSLTAREEREAWIERFWIELDPTPTTARNERRTEHEQRVIYVKEHFGISKEPGWDRRGETYILYGEPDVRNIIGPELIHPSVYPPKEKWYYESLGIYVTFEDLTHNGEYTHEIMPYSCGRIMMAGSPNADFDPVMFARNPFLYIPSLDQTEKEFSNPRKKPYYHPCDLVMNKFPVYFDVSFFKGGPGKVMAEVSFEIPAKEILFIPDDDLSYAKVDFQIMARDFSFDSVTSAAQSVSVTVPGERAPEILDNLNGQLRLSLEPGYYRFGIEVIDRNALRRCAYNTIVTIPDMDSGLVLSDIQFARLIRETERKERFTKGNLQIVPHPLHAYRKPSTVKIYFEIYGLETDRNDVSFYSIEYRIEPQEKRRWGPVLVETHILKSSRFELSGYGAKQGQRLEIDTTELWQGSYELLILVTDRISRIEVSQSATFSIIDK